MSNEDLDLNEFRKRNAWNDKQHIEKLEQQLAELKALQETLPTNCQKCGLIFGTFHKSVKMGEKTYVCCKCWDEINGPIWDHDKKTIVHDGPRRPELLPQKPESMSSEDWAKMHIKWLKEHIGDIGNGVAPHMQAVADKPGKIKMRQNYTWYKQFDDGTHHNFGMDYEYLGESDN